MKIQFEDDLLLACFESSSRASRRWGATVGRAYLRAVERLLLVNSLSELKAFSGVRAHALTGQRKGQWSLTIHGRWRLIFAPVDAQTVRIIEAATTMTTKVFSRGDLRTDVALPPGDFIADEIAGRGLTTDDLALAMDVPSQTVAGLLSSRRRVSATLALSLEAALGIPAHLWMDMQSEYDLARARGARARSSQRAI